MLHVALRHVSCVSTWNDFNFYILSLPRRPECALVGDASGRLLVWSLHDGGKLRCLDACGLGGRITTLRCVQLSCGGDGQVAPPRAAAAVAGADGSVQVVDLAAARVAARVQAHRGAVHSVEWLSVQSRPRDGDDTAGVGPLLQPAEAAAGPCADDPCQLSLMTACDDDGSISFFSVHMDLPPAAAPAVEVPAPAGSSPSSNDQRPPSCVSAAPDPGSDATAPHAAPNGVQTAIGGSAEEEPNSRSAVPQRPSSAPPPHPLGISMTQTGGFRLPKLPQGLSEVQKGRQWLAARALPAAFTQQPAARPRVAARRPSCVLAQHSSNGGDAPQPPALSAASQVSALQMVPGLLSAAATAHGGEKAAEAATGEAVTVAAEEPPVADIPAAAQDPAIQHVPVPAAQAGATAVGSCFWVAAACHGGAVLFFRVSPHGSRPLAMVRPASSGSGGPLHTRCIFSLDFVRGGGGAPLMVTTSMDRSLLVSRLLLQQQPQPLTASSPAGAAAGAATIGEDAAASAAAPQSLLDAVEYLGLLPPPPPAQPAPPPLPPPTPSVAAPPLPPVAAATAVADPRRPADAAVAGCSPVWRLTGLGGYPYCVAASCSGSRLAAGCGDKTIRLMELQALHSVRRPQGRLALACTGYGAALWFLPVLVAVAQRMNECTCTCDC